MKNKSVQVFGRFDDYTLWYETFLKMLEQIPSLRQYRKINRLAVKIETMTQKNKYKFKLKSSLFTHLKR
jgi:hypothetical protein